MLDTCPGILDNFCVSFHNGGNVRPQLTTKHRSPQALWFISPLGLIWARAPRVEVLHHGFVSVPSVRYSTICTIATSRTPPSWALAPNQNSIQGTKTVFQTPCVSYGFSFFSQASCRWGSDHRSWAWKFIWSMLLFACFSGHDSLTNVARTPPRTPTVNQGTAVVVGTNSKELVWTCPSQWVLLHPGWHCLIHFFAAFTHSLLDESINPARLLLLCF